MQGVVVACCHYVDTEIWIYAYSSHIRHYIKLIFNRIIIIIMR